MDNQLLTTKDLSARWQVTERTINDYKAQGIIVPVKGLPCIRYNPNYIAELEGTRLEKFSPLERKKLERELEEVTRERDLLKTIVSNNLAECSKVINLIK